MLRRTWRKGNTCTPLEGMEIGIATIKKCMDDPPQLKPEPPYDPEISLLGIYVREIKSLSHSHVHCSTIHNSQDEHVT